MCVWGGGGGDTNIGGSQTGICFTRKRGVNVWVCWRGWEGGEGRDDSLLGCKKKKRKGYLVGYIGDKLGSKMYMQY